MILSKLTQDPSLYVVREAEIPVPDGTDLDAIAYCGHLFRPVLPVRDADGDRVHVGDAVLRAGPGFRFVSWHDGEPWVAGAMFAREDEMRFLFLDGKHAGKIQGMHVTVADVSLHDIGFLVRNEDGIRYRGRSFDHLIQSDVYREIDPASFLRNGCVSLTFVGLRPDGIREIVRAYGLCGAFVALMDDSMLAAEGIRLLSPTNQSLGDGNEERTMAICANSDGKTAVFQGERSERPVQLTPWADETRHKTVFTNWYAEIAYRVGDAWSVIWFTPDGKRILAPEQTVRDAGPVLKHHDGDGTTSALFRLVRDDAGTAFLVSKPNGCERVPADVASLDLWQEYSGGMGVCLIRSDDGKLRFASFHNGADRERKRERLVPVPTGIAFDRVLAARFVDQFLFLATVDVAGVETLVTIHDVLFYKNPHIQSTDTRWTETNAPSLITAQTASGFLLPVRNDRGWWPSDGKNAIGPAPFDRIVGVSHRTANNAGGCIDRDSLRWCGFRGNRLVVATGKLVTTFNP